MPRKTELEKHAARGFAKFKRAAAASARKTLRAGGRAAANYVRSGALTRDVGLIGGSNAEAAARAFTGHGDYTMVRGRGFRNVEEKGSMSDRKRHRDRGHHAHVSFEKGEMLITHSEYVGELVSGTTAGFVSQSYGINPGNQGTFPWLSSVANNFQDYRFDKLIFEYKPLTSDSLSSASASVVSMGSVIMATQYDSISGPYPNKPQMENSDYAVSCKPSEHCQMAIECDPRFNPLGVLYVSPSLNISSGTANSDIRMQNLGIIQVASQGVPTNGVATDLGELWVHYTVKLMKPQLGGGLTSLLSAHYISTTATGAPATTSPFGTTVSAANQPNFAANSMLSLTFTSNTVTFPLAVTEGSFQLTYYCIGDAASFNANACTGTNCTVLQMWGSNTTADVYRSGIAPEPSLAGDTQCMISCIVQVNAPGSALASVSFNTLVIPTNGRFDFFATPWNSLITV